MQQAAEKMIKIQIYASGVLIDNAKIYKHSLDDLLIYASSLSLAMNVPSYVQKNKTVISSWEAEGRYDIHFVVRIDQLKRCYQELQNWYNEMIKEGYR